MNFINKFVGNYGVTIIILTILIKAVLWIPQSKSNQSMRRMQLLSPKLKELQEKHKDNPQRLQDEMMKLYRDYNVNPLGGCLPLLVQMPIFIGFYYMLLSAVELRHASFLWMSDLSQSDTITRLPVFGMAIPINPMPLVMGATMYWSMNITPQTQTADNPTANMMKFMPLLILLVCYNFSSALSLYWTVQNILSIGQMYYNLKQPAPKLEKIAHPQQSHKPSKTKGFFETLHSAHKEAQKKRRNKE
jgi:YidC/Oxa1 family membrane protein insertase